MECLFFSVTGEKMKRILINKSLTDEIRVALVEGAKLYDLDNETSDKNLLKGSIFKARVSRVETSLDAAFVYFGSERHGFLPLKELTSEYFEKDNEGKRKCTLKENDEIIVQVLKEERGTKGAALSTQLSLAGRFLVLIPNSTKGGGVSRRISGEERDQVKDIIKNLPIPEGMSVIVRTAGLGRNQEELQWDLDYLLSLWKQISSNLDESECPSLIYKDDKLILRVFRDYFKEDIEEILIDDKDVFEEASMFAQSVIPDHATKVQFYNEEIPLFNRYQVESQIESAFQREISLPSGGSIVIDPTEAMVTIDVNSSRATKGKDIEETALATNMEAAVEVARQLRLRDLGGLVVIDFIDMQDETNQSKVLNAVRRAVHGDRARIQISEISRFGLLELSRQRLRPSLNETYDIEHVLVRGPKSLGQSILRIVGEDAAKENTAEIHVFVPADVASYLLNEKRREIITIENMNKVAVIVVADPYKSRPYYKVARVKSSDVKGKTSYQMTPQSPEPDMSWRDADQTLTNNKPLVEVTAPPKMPKRKKSALKGIFSFLFNNDSKNKKKKKSNNKRKPRAKTQHTRKNKQHGNKNSRRDNRRTPQKNNRNRRPQNRNNKTSNDRKSPNENKNNANNRLKNQQKDTAKNPAPIKKETVQTESSKVKSKITEVAQPASQEVKDAPKRAKNDPRYKSE